MNTHFKTIILVGAVSLGILVGYETAYATEITIGIMFVVIGQGIVYATERKREAEGFALSLATIVFSIGLLIGIIRVQLVQEKIPYTCESTCSFEAKVISSPASKDTYQVVVVHPSVLPAQAGGADTVLDVQLRVPLYPRYEIGQTVQVSGKVTVPKIIPPHGETKSFDYVTYLGTKNIGSEMMFPKVEVIDSDAHTLTSILGRWKEDMVMRLTKYTSSPASVLAAGMLFGSSGTSKELTQTFRVAGLSHIVVLSGFNIAIVIASMLFIFAFVPLVFRITLASVFVILFVMMVGVQASIMRATAMAFIALIATLVGRAYVARQALLLSLFVIILYEPNALLSDVSLHLSFLATAGIVYLREPIEKITQSYIKQKSVCELVTTTLSAYCATLPYVMYMFGTVSVYALIANVLVLPFVPMAMLLSFFVVVSSYVSDGVALLFGYADTILINGIILVARTAESLPFSSFTLTISFASMCLWYGAISGLLIFFSRHMQNETLPTCEKGYLTDSIKY